MPHVCLNCLRFRPSGLEPLLGARLRKLASDQRQAQSSCRRPSPRTASGPLDRRAPRAKGSSARDRGLGPVPTPLPVPGLELQNTSRAVGGRDTPEPLSAPSQPGHCGHRASRSPLPAHETSQRSPQWGPVPASLALQPSLSASQTRPRPSTAAGGGDTPGRGTAAP